MKPVKKLVIASHVLANIEERIGYEFKDRTILTRALVHKSYCYEVSRETAHNETFEFLGDAVVNLVVAEFLLETFPGNEEGDLSKRRASVVNAQTLADLARQLDLGRFIIMGKGEAAMGGAEKTRILASTFEAICGAIYLDGGFELSKNFILKFVKPLSHRFAETTAFSADYKTRLQEIAQKEQRRTPTYEVVHEEGPSHDKLFTVAVRIGDYVVAMGKGKSKKLAEQMAARKVIEDREVGRNEIHTEGGQGPNVVKTETKEE